MKCCIPCRRKRWSFSHHYRNKKAIFLKLSFYFVGCIGSSLLRTGFLQLRRAGATLHCNVWASHCSGFSCCRARALGAWASVVAACRLSSCGTQALEHAGFSSCHAWAQQLWLMGSRAQAQQLWPTGLAAPRHVGSSQTRAQTCVSCAGRWILNHCATREVPRKPFLLEAFSSYQTIVE